MTLAVGVIRPVRFDPASQDLAELTLKGLAPAAVTGAANQDCASVSA